MALPDTLKLVIGTAKVFSNDAGSEYSPSDPGQPTGTDATIDLQNILTAGAARQSVKLDLGSVNLDALWTMKAYIEWFTTAPTAGGTVDFYLGFSHDATAGEDNPGNLSGTDAAFTGYGATVATGTAALKQLTYVGSLVATNEVDLQVQTVGVFQPTARYCCLVVVTNSSVALAVTDAIETGVAIWPVQHQVQD